MPNSKPRIAAFTLIILFGAVMTFQSIIASDLPIKGVTSSAGLDANRNGTTELIQVKIKLLNKAQDLLNFLALTRLEKEADPISAADKDKCHPVIFTLGSPAPAAYKNAALDWVKYQKSGLGKVPVICATGRGRGYSELVRMTLRFLSQEDSSNKTDLLIRFNRKYAADTGAASSKAVNILRSEYEKLSAEGRVDASVLTEAKIAAFILEAYGVDPEIITLQERSDNTYDDWRFSAPLLEKMQKLYDDKDVHKPLKIRIVAADFHRMRALVVGIGMLIQGKEVNSHLASRGRSLEPIAWNKDWLINGQSSEQAKFAVFSEDDFAEYTEHMLGSPGAGRGEIEALQIFTGEWLVFSPVLQSVVKDTYSPAVMKDMRQNYLAPYLEAKKSYDNSQQPTNKHR